MKYFLAVILLLLSTTICYSSKPSEPNDVIIARIVRQAVRDADPDLLNAQLLSGWRDYLKLAAMDLEMMLQPLVLIKFDEDIGFRHQLKQLIEWEKEWHKQETEHFIYYYRWEQPIPTLVLEVQEVLFRELTGRFAIQFKEKIPYHYDLTVDKSIAFGFDDLRGGIVSPQPFDLEKAAYAIFSNKNSDLQFLTQPLARIYGSYFQNPSTSLAYYNKCLKEIKTMGYVSATELCQLQELEQDHLQDWYSVYVFAYKLNQQFDSSKLAAFLEMANCHLSKELILNTFEEIFGMSLEQFETNQNFLHSVQKF